jgi:hypothetical protein
LVSICSLWNQRWTTEVLSRLLVVLTGLLLFAMPVTEYFCDWDHFLRGGPDVEFTVLALLLFAAMVVLTMNGTILHPGWMARSMRAVAGDRDRAQERGVLSGARAEAAFLRKGDLNPGWLLFSPLRV